MDAWSDQDGRRWFCSVEWYEKEDRPKEMFGFVLASGLVDVRTSGAKNVRYFTIENVHAEIAIRVLQRYMRIGDHEPGAPGMHREPKERLGALLRYLAENPSAAAEFCSAARKAHSVEGREALHASVPPEWFVWQERWGKQP